MDDTQAVRLSALAHGGGCGCKLDPAVLSDILGGAPAIPMPSELLVDAATRDDAAVWRINDETVLVATTDFFTPIVDDPEVFGKIAATNALSDVYAMGATPIFCLAIVGMPVNKLPREMVRAILAGGRSVAEAAGAPIAGGHSIDAAEPIYGLVALGTAHPDRLKTNAGAKAGDVLVLGKSIGVGVFSAALKRGELSPEAYDAMVACSVGSPQLKERMCENYKTLGQVIIHELAIAHPNLKSTSCEELSFMFVSMMHAHWSFVASLGYSREHSKLARKAIDRLIESYLNDPDHAPAMDRPWSRAP